jgi:hypothetical protein
VASKLDCAYKFYRDSPTVPSPEAASRQGSSLLGGGLSPSVPIAANHACGSDKAGKCISSNGISRNGLFSNGTFSNGSSSSGILSNRNAINGTANDGIASRELPTTANSTDTGMLINDNDTRVPRLGRNTLVTGNATSVAPDTPVHSVGGSSRLNSYTDPEQESFFRRAQRLDLLEGSRPVFGLAETNRSILARQTGLDDLKVLLNKTRIIGWSHWIWISKEASEVKKAVDGF